MRCSPRAIIGTFLFLLYITELPQDIVSHLFLYAVDKFIFFKHKHFPEIEKQLLRDFSTLCDWFVGNELSIYFNQGKTKLILFGTKHKL